MNFICVKTMLVAAAAMVSLSSFSQDLIARQAPIDRKLKSVDSLALQKQIRAEQAAYPAYSLYPSWNNEYVHVAYIPNGYITGLSKIARVVDIFSHRLQVQERMTLQIKECIQQTLNPLGVMVVVEAKHMCMQMRGVEKQNAITTTSDFSGAFKNATTRSEFMDLIAHK